MLRRPRRHRGIRAAFGSIAGSARLDPNHLKLAGWHPGETWGNEVAVAQFDYLLAGGKPMTLRNWTSRGVARAGGKPVRRASDKLFLLLPAAARGSRLPDAEQFPRDHALQSGRGFMR